MARERAGYEKATDAARARGWVEVTYRAHEGGRREITRDMASVYAAAFGVSPEWILFGTNSPPWGFSEMRGRPAFRMVPVLSLREAGMCETVKSDPNRELVAVDTGAGLGKNLVAVYVPDESMIANPPSVDASFSEGDVIVFDRDAMVEPGDFCLVVVPGYDEPIFRKYRSRSGGVFELVPLNADYPSETVLPHHKAKIIGRLVRHIRTF